MVSFPAYRQNLPYQVGETCSILLHCSLWEHRSIIFLALLEHRVSSSSYSLPLRFLPRNLSPGHKEGNPISHLSYQSTFSSSPYYQPSHLTHIKGNQSSCRTETTFIPLCILSPYPQRGRTVLTFQSRWLINLILLGVLLCKIKSS